MRIRKKITNPMTIIAIFALISESSAAISLPFLDNDEREIYIWFLISFPFYLLLLFFLTLNFNYRSLYAPSDFDRDDSFLKSLDEFRVAESNPGLSEVGKSDAVGRSTCNTFEWTPSGCSDQKKPRRTGADISTAKQPWIEHNVQLPKPIGTLRAIDIRPVNNSKALTTLSAHLPRLCRQPAKAVVFLTDSASDVLLRQITLSLIKQSKKSGGAKLFIAYNVSTQSTTVLRGI